MTDLDPDRMYDAWPNVPVADAVAGGPTRAFDVVGPHLARRANNLRAGTRYCRRWPRAIWWPFRSAGAYGAW